MKIRVCQITTFHPAAKKAMEANGRLQGSNNKCLSPECLVEAAAGDFEGTGGKRQASRL